MPGYFDPLPEGELDLDKIKQWVQNNTDTFRRSIAMQGTLFSSDFVSGTSGWILRPNGRAEFNEDVIIGGENTTNSQLHIHNILQHIAIYENDGANYPEDFFTVDANAEAARLFWSDLDGANPTINYGGISINGPQHANAHDIRFTDSARAAVLTWDDSLDQWLFNDGTAGAPAISFLVTGQQDVGFFRAGTDEIGVAVGGAEVLRVDGAGVTDHKDVGIVKARAQNLSPNTIATSEVAEETATLVIPTDWNTYDIEAICQTDVFESGTLTGIRVVTLRIRLTNATGTLMGLTEVEINTTDPNRWSGVVQGYLAGQSATGNVPVVFTTEIPADTGQASTDNTTFIVTAYRTS